MMSNFIRGLVEEKNNEEVHNAFVRYSIGEFQREPFIVKLKKEVVIYAGFEYLNFLHLFCAENLKEDVEISGIIESVRDLSEILGKMGIKFSEERRFGKSGSKFALEKQKLAISSYKKLVQELFKEYLLFDVFYTGGGLKVKKKTTPKLGSPTDKFITVRLPIAFLKAVKEDYLFDVTGDFKEVTIEHKYNIKQINIDQKLLQKDANLARREALRKGEILRKVIVDGKVVKEYKINFSV